MFSFALSLLLVGQGQTGPLTKAESSGFKETSTYADVVKFLDELKATGAPIDIRSSGVSTEGKKIPMVIAARPMVKDPAEAAKSGKLIIYIQANIHAGEVEGKEAALHLLRRYCQKSSGVLDKAILIVQPIYNIDGNEKFGPQARNRPGQNGPEMVGVRPNGQNFDLNRDCMKVESPEMTGVLKFIYPWNPHAMFDLHTTDGTRHGYPLTYAGPNEPNSHPLLQAYCFNEFFPQIRKTVKVKFGTEIFDYGNGVFENEKWKFETFGAEPRYVTNYAGLRNTIGILSEAMVYETFENRIKDTEHFVDECLNKLLSDAPRIKAMRKKMDAEVVQWGKNPKMAPMMATRYKMKLRGTEDVLLEKDLRTGGRRSGPVRDLETIPMPVWDRFEGDRYQPLPFAYIVPKSATKAVDLMKLHGVQFYDLDGAGMVSAQEFHVTKFDQAKGAFQGHKLITLEGNWTDVKAPTGSYIVLTGQPLGLLIFNLLQPDTVDGLTAWGAFGESFEPGTTHPVLRVSLPVKLNLKRN
ncbi:MAG: M14 family zinc carboxypeptidase [Armatimonadota bacterium]